MDEFKKLFLLLKEYLEAQKDNMALAAAESMTVMLSAVALGFILILLASVLLLLLSPYGDLGAIIGCDVQ